MSFLYIDESLVDPVIGAVVILRGAEGKHAVSVSRVRVGEIIAISNGRGLRVTGTVARIHNDEVGIHVAEVHRRENNQPLIMLVQALAKGDRDELAIQAATELGVAAVVPWQANRSIVRWTGAKIERGRERWASIVREASKQSIRAHVPRVYSLVSTMQLAAFAEEWDLFVLDPHARERLTVVDLPSPQVGRPLALIVGPEGGVSDSEMALLAEAGARCVCLGEEVLRTSTAGPAAIAVLNAKLGRW